MANLSPADDRSPRAARCPLRELHSAGPARDAGHAARRHRRGGRGVGGRVVHAHGPLVPDGAARRARRADARGLHQPGVRRRPHADDEARPARHRRHLPPPGIAGQDRHHARRAVAGPRHARHRRRLVRARAPGAGRPLPRHRRALRAPRGGARDLRADVERRRRAVRGEALPTGLHAVQPAAGQHPAPVRGRRWRGRAQDAAARDQARRRDEHVRDGAGRPRPQGRGAAPPLRDRGARPRRDPADAGRRTRPGDRDRCLPAGHGGVRGARLQPRADRAGRARPGRAGRGTSPRSSPAWAGSASRPRPPRRRSPPRARARAAGAAAPW